jgi:hypothetical protein
MVVDFLLRAVWVAGYAVLIRVFIIAKSIETLGSKRRSTSLPSRVLQNTDSSS